MPEQTFQKRQVAHKVRVSDILDAGFAKDELSAGYVKLNNANVSRVNVIAALVHKSEGSFANAVIDDGTGKIPLRAFENTGIFSKADVGDFVIVVGKIREFNSERYIMPEILRKIDVGWMNLRRIELKNNVVADDVKVNKSMNGSDLVEKADSAADAIYMLIKKLDSGDGASVDEIIKGSNYGNAESAITRLMESGDIFEVKPGRLKVLE